MGSYMWGCLPVLLNWRRVRKRMNRHHSPSGCPEATSCLCSFPVPPDVSCILTLTLLSRFAVAVDGEKLCCEGRLGEEVAGFTPHPYTFFPWTKCSIVLVAMLRCVRTPLRKATHIASAETHAREMSHAIIPIWRTGSRGRQKTL
jgi:hypothetical protein